MSLSPEMSDAGCEGELPGDSGAEGAVAQRLQLDPFPGDEEFIAANVQLAYERGLRDGMRAMAHSISDLLNELAPRTKTEEVLARTHGLLAPDA